MELSNTVDHTHATMNLPTLKTMKSKSKGEENKSSSSSGSGFLKLPGQGKTVLNNISINTNISGVSTDCPSGLEIAAQGDTIGVQLNTSVSDISEGDQYILLAKVEKKVEIKNGSISDDDEPQDDIESNRILALKPQHK